MLHKYVKNYDINNVQKLLTDGADPNIMNSKYKNCLHIACNRNTGDNFEMESLLLKYHTKLNS